MFLRKATVEDIEVLLPIFAQARRAQRLAGFVQWADGYPSAGDFETDISRSAGYVLDDCGTAAGYVAIAIGDREYDRHPELWDAAAPYAVFHRIALADAYRGKGNAAELFSLAEDIARRLGAHYIRIDTGLENRPMQRVLANRSYTALGPCTFIWGPRLAYEKRLNQHSRKFPY